MDAAQGIHEGNERFRAAVRAADSATMPSLYTDDAVILPPNGEAVTGTDAIAQYWQAFAALGITDARPVTLEVIPMGDYALEVGETTVYGENGSGEDHGAVEERRRCLEDAPGHLEQQPPSTAAIERASVGSSPIASTSPSARWRRSDAA